jgi:hypothetical protein
MKLQACVALCATLIVGCGDGGTAAEQPAPSTEAPPGSSTAPAPTTGDSSLTAEERAALSRYIADSDHVNATARNCAGASIVASLGARRLDEFTEGAAATETEANFLFDQYSKCVKWSGVVINALMGSLRHTEAQARCVIEKGPTDDDVKPLVVAAFQRTAAPPLSAEARLRYQDAIAQCVQ